MHMPNRTSIEYVRYYGRTAITQTSNTIENWHHKRTLKFINKYQLKVDEKIAEMRLVNMNRPILASVKLP